MITFVIPGKPHAWQRRDKHGRTPPATRAWEKLVAQHAAAASGGIRGLRVPLRLDATFIFARPKNPTHPETGTTKTPTGERYELPPGRSPYWPTPDRDNLIKGVMDGITQAKIWRDDCYVCDGSNPKYYAAIGEQPHTTVTITRITQ